MIERKPIIQEKIEGIYRIAIPVPFALKWVNCYLLRDGDGWVLVDTGLNYPTGVDTWKQFFAQTDIVPRDIRTIIITHFHPDHYGAAGMLQSWTGARVLMSETDHHTAGMAWNPVMAREDIRLQYLIGHGVPRPTASAILESMAMRIDWVKPEPQIDNFLKHGDEIAMGGGRWSVLVTPGHTDGHLCFYEPDRRLLLSGDHLLPHITSNISLWPGRSPNPLLDYLQSLAAIKGMPVHLVLPSHGPVFQTFTERISAMQEHHHQRLMAAVAAVNPGGTTAFEAMGRIFGSDLSLSDTRFAIAETLAHLEYLVMEGRLVKEVGETVLYFPPRV